jgi:anti-anti-sigma factor
MTPLTPILDLDSRSLTIRLPGDPTSTNAEGLRAELSDCLGLGQGAPQQWNTFVLDLAAAKMVDSAGLNLIVSLLKWVEKRGGKMRVACSAPAVLRAFTFTRLDRHLELVKT